MKIAGKAPQYRPIAAAFLIVAGVFAALPSVRSVPARAELMRFAGIVNATRYMSGRHSHSCKLIYLDTFGPSRPIVIWASAPANRVFRQIAEGDRLEGLVENCSGACRLAPWELTRNGEATIAYEDFVAANQFDASLCYGAAAGFAVAALLFLFRAFAS